MNIFKRIVPLMAIILTITVISSAAQKAPGFALIDNKGQYIFKSKLKGNLIISFWASYCKPCMKEMPEIIKMEEKYGSKKNLKLVLINVDDNRGSSAKEKAAKFLNDLGISRTYLMDSYQKIITKYNPKRKVPATFIVDKRGNFVLKMIGYHKDTLTKLEKAIKRLR